MRLMTTKEYFRLYDNIPAINCKWWVLNEVNNNPFVVFGNKYSAVKLMDDWNDIGIRPVIDVTEETKIGDRFIKYGFPWVVIDRNLAIAEVPIAFDFSSQVNQVMKSWTSNRD